jgi:hypothetical protein
VLRRTTGNSDSQDSPRPGLGWLPLYNILCASPRGSHPNDILSWDSQMGASKFPKLGLLQLWGPITLCADLRLRWILKENYSPCRELSNGMSHTTCTQGNQVNSWLLVVGSQIASYDISSLISWLQRTRFILMIHYNKNLQAFKPNNITRKKLISLIHNIELLTKNPTIIQSFRRSHHHWW